MKPYPNRVMIRQCKERRMFSLKMSQLGRGGDMAVFFKYLRHYQTEETLAFLFNTPEKRTRTKGGRWWQHFKETGFSSLEDDLE